MAANRSKWKGKRWSSGAASLIGLALALAMPSAFARGESGAAGVRPNIMLPNVFLIVADDMGYSDLGVFGGEIATPHLDALARGGVMMLDFHASPACSPTRATLLTGQDHHRVGMGGMAEFIDDRQRGQPGYEGYLLPVPTIASYLRDAGYFTAMAGKWHLGDGEDRSAAARGFDRSFTLIEGAANHYGLGQSPAWRAAGPGLGASYRQDGKPATFPVGAYSSDEYTRRMIDYLQSAERGNRPFFGYLAFTAPHWPLQALEEDRRRYAGRYDDGPEALRTKRLAAMRAQGIVPRAIVPHPMRHVADWARLTPEQRVAEARKMEIHAAMVDRLDRNVGRLIAVLRERGELDNSLFLFLSDNGPDGFQGGGPRGISPQAVADLGIDNRTENLGNANSFIAYGGAWAQAGSAPYSRFKGYVSEGGTRVPAFIAGPGVKGGRRSDALASVADLLPTILEFAHASCGGCEARIDGRSLRPVLTGRAVAVRDDGDVLAEEYSYGSSIRMGRWKAMRLQPGNFPFVMGSADGRWQLYDMRADPGETVDLAARKPGVLRRLMAAWSRYARAAHIVPPPPYPEQSPDTPAESVSHDH